LKLRTHLLPRGGTDRIQDDVSPKERNVIQHQTTTCDSSGMSSSEL
jgi:hypothetical protein